MAEDQQLARSLSQVLDNQIIALQPMGVPYGSNRLYQIETAAGQRYVVKVPKPVRESISPFWQQMAAIFGVNRATQFTALPSIVARLQQQAWVPVPQVIHIETNAALPGAPYAVVTYLDGDAYEPDSFPASAELHYQLGQYVGYLHTQAYSGYGNVMEPHQSKANFIATIIAGMRRTIQQFWHDQPELHDQLDRLVATMNADALFSTAVLMMVDISANQFVYHNQRISGVVDLDAYVIGPREWELSILEMCITDPIAFRQGYEGYAILPTFAPFRTFYRLWSYLNEPHHGYKAEDFSRFMQQSIYFA